MNRRQPFHLPENMLLGCATAATQIEGGGTENSWHEWAAKPGTIRDGTSPARGNDHWNRMEEDVALMAELGLQCARIGIEWSRVEPQEGQFDADALDHYHRELELLKANGIRTLVTLHHFSNPLWLERKGAFETKECIPLFLRFVAKVVTFLKDVCDAYVTINEPNVYAVFGYYFGTWPPGQKHPFSAFRVMKNMAICHIKAYQAIHEIYGDSTVHVGFANHLRVFKPLTSSPLDRMGARLLDRIFQGAMTEAFLTGRFRLPIGMGTPAGTGRFYDFLGINYYTRDHVRSFTQLTPKGLPMNDLGWEIYPEGLAELCQEQYKHYQAPVWITENGTCVQDDRIRVAYLHDHIQVLVSSGVPVERYHYWTFMDNFEWAEGESAPFGLVACDFPTQARSVRPSGRFFAEMIRKRGVDEDMVERYE